METTETKTSSWLILIILALLISLAKCNTDKEQAEREAFALREQLRETKTDKQIDKWTDDYVDDIEAKYNEENDR